MTLLNSLLPLTIEAAPASGIMGYLGETNVFNVLIVLALAVGLYKFKNMSLARGLDNKISETLGGLSDAESIASILDFQLAEAQKELDSLKDQRAERVKAAELRGKSYAQRLNEEMDRKIHQLSLVAVQTRKLAAQRIERESLLSIATSLKHTTVETLPHKISTDMHQKLIVDALKDIEDIYWESCSRTKHEVAVS